MKSNLNVNQGCTAKTLHNTMSDCAYLFKNLRFLTVTVYFLLFLFPLFNDVPGPVCGD